jgi:phosphoesterase RecJ-like protein
MGIALDANIGACIYAAILTDTGGFKFSNATPEIFQLAARLVEAGVQPDKVYKQIYEVRPKSQTMLHAEVIRLASFSADGTVVWTDVPRSTLTRFGALDEHTEGIVETLRQIEGTQVAAIFKETPEGHVKVSMRSNHQNLNVADVAENFGGGGHKFAAGCTLTTSLEAARAQVLPKLEAAVRQATAQPV